MTGSASAALNYVVTAHPPTAITACATGKYFFDFFKFLDFLITYYLIIVLNLMTIHRTFLARFFKGFTNEKPILFRSFHFVNRSKSDFGKSESY